MGPLNHFFPGNVAFSYQALRAAAYAGSGGADVAEVIAVCARIQSGDEAGWLREWARAGERAAAYAAGSSGSSTSEDPCGAADGLLRASNYFRTAEFFRRGYDGVDDPCDDHVVRDLSDRAQRCFVDAMALMASAITAPGVGCIMDEVKIPYEDEDDDDDRRNGRRGEGEKREGEGGGNEETTTLPGYFFSPDRSGVKRRTIIFNGGFDSTKEEAWFAIGAAAVRRGYNVLAFDGPGQGAALRQQRLRFRPDWERVLGPVVDYALSRSDVDAGKLVLFGWGMGAYLVARAAASGETRAAALVLDDGVFDFGAAFRARQPLALQRLVGNGYNDGGYYDLLVTNPLLAVLKATASSGDRWALLNGKWTFGTASEAGFLREVNKYTLEGRAGDIKTPCLVLDAPEDHFLKGQPKLLYDNLTCEKVFVSLGAEMGAETHCHMGAFRELHQVIFSYLNEKLASK